ncbi:MAG: AI-2E family transporter [Flavobacterium sp.]|nr:AI-2E family transporter [Flavobacterium sp.]
MITSKTIASGILKAVTVIALVSLLLVFIYKIQSVLIYIVLAIVFSLIANPIVEFLKHKLKFKNALAVITTLLIFLVIFVGLLFLFVPMLLSESSNLSLLDTNSIEKKCLEVYSQLNFYLQKRNINLSQVIKSSDLTSKLNFSFFTNFFNSVLSTISSFGIGLGATLFISFFFLKDKVTFITGIKTIIPDSNEAKILNSIHKTKDLLSRYFIGLAIQLVIVSLLYLIVLLIFGVQNAFVIAFLCAILNIIPYVGPLIGAILAGILTMLSNINSDFQTQTLPTTIYVIIGFIIVHLFDSNVASPIIFSKSVNSHPLEIFLIILIAGILFGIVGMIIAVPLYTILKVVGKEFLPNNKIIQLLTQNI